MILTNHRERNRFLKFAVVGSIGAIVDFGVFNILSAGLKVNPVVSSVLSFICAVVSNFVWNRFWTYPDSRSKPFSAQFAQFAFVNVVGLAIRTPLFAWMEPRLVSFSAKELMKLFGRLAISPSMLGHNMSLAIAILVVTFWNFYANRFWTYSDVE